MLSMIERYAQGAGPDPVKGAVAGAVGGFVGTLRTTRMGTAWNRINRSLEKLPTRRLRPLAKRRGADEEPLPPFGDRTTSQARQQVAAAAVRPVHAAPMTPRQREVGEMVVHRVTGALIGAAYGVTVEYMPGLSRWYGLPLGLVVFLLGREATLRALGLAPGPRRRPPADHVVSLASDLAFGFFTELVRGRLRKE